ncbi:MAG: hypothetical protein ACI9OJ_002234 [Myxococcota bacterium]|jgi:hypothetical protein
MSDSVRRMVLGLLVVLAIGLVAWVLMRKPAEATADCTPEGGLRCVDGAIHMCQSGVTALAGECPGGCTDTDGVARCAAQDGTLTAPLGAACQAGMALCGVGAQSLVVCRDGVLAAGADCPGGCFENGEGGGLYCADGRGSIRFAEGFPCPKFPGASRKFACGADGTEILICKDGLLATHSMTCDRCIQRRSGQLACTDENNAQLDPETGKVAETASTP